MIGNPKHATNSRNREAIEKALPILLEGSDTERDANILASSSYDTKMQSMKIARTAVEYVCMSMGKAWGVDGRVCALLLTNNAPMYAAFMIEGPFLGPKAWLQRECTVEEEKEKEDEQENENEEENEKEKEKRGEQCCLSLRSHTQTKLQQCSNPSLTFS